MLKGVLFSFFTSSPRLISGPTIMSPQQYLYLGLECFLLTKASVFPTLVSFYLGLQKYLHSRYPRGVCSIVIPAAYLFAEGCIVFTCLIVSKTHIRVYNKVSSAVFISRIEVLSPQHCSYLGLYIYSLGELLLVPAELISK